VPQGLHVCHRCDNPPCVNPAHLFLGDRTANMRDMASKGRYGRVDPAVLRAASAKLTEADVAEIRRRLAAGASQFELARAYGVEQTTISHINRRSTWSDVPGPEGRHTCECRGVRNGRAKLNDDAVRDIRLKREPIKAQAARYGVSEFTIEQVRARKKWAHVE
jgi:hypothetical protein